MPDTPDILSGLNTAQRAAVVHDSGPLMVLAGPGTGKTRVITHRVAHLIRERGADPESIVAVTYTVKAARQLRERLHDLVGHAAERVHAHTFHGLGFRLIRRFADVIDLPPPSMNGESGGGGGGIMDSAQERRHLRAIITQHNLFPHARAAGLDSAVDQVSRAVGALADAAITNEDARAFIVQARQRLAGGRALDDSALDAEALAAELARVHRLEEIIAAAEHFEHARRASGTLSYADLIALPTRILRTSPHAAAIIRDEFRHIVVDEFQDVNTAQIRFLQAIAPPERHPDLCIVGDDDQSIYEFRGADDRAFARFAAIWKGAHQIELSENYRSAPVIIDTANSIIARAETRFAPDKRITPPAKPDPERGISASVRCIQLRDDKLDGETIAAMLLLDRAESAASAPDSSPRPWKSFAVVCRSHTDAARVKDALDIEGIPALVARTGAAAEDEGVKDVFAWIQTIVRPRMTHAAVRLLVRPPFSAPLAKVQQWERAYRARLSRFEAATGEEFDESTATDPGGFIDFLAANHADDPIVARLAALHDEFRGYNASHAAAETIFRIITSADPAHADLLPARERARRVSDLVTLVRFARERQSRLDEPGDLRAFWSYYEDLSADDQKLGDSAAASPDERVDGASTGSSDPDDPDAVRIITAHSAKGLEFDTVFVPRVTPQWGYGKSGSSDDDPDFPDGLIVRSLPGESPSSLSDKERRLAEERRVFYVACTRAERRLVLLAKKNKARSKSTHFLEEIIHDSEPGVRSRIAVLSGEDTLKQAAAAGLGRSIANGGADRTALDEEAANFAPAEARREVFDRARRDVRTRAAAALDHAANPDASPDHADESGAVLRDAAARLAALSYAQSNNAAPPWADERNVGDYIRSILDRAGSDAEGDAPARAGIIIPKPPLDLSYSVIDQYLRCPRCYYLRHILLLDPLPGTAQVVGSAVHEAMEKFALECRAAEGEGRPAPGSDRLLDLGRRAFFRHWPKDEEVDRQQLDQIAAQLALAFERLHDPSANILEIEKRIPFKYSTAASPSVKHNFVAKIDRIDQVALEDGSTGFRIVDYKTGKDSKRFREPKPDDLQLGVYALALAHLYGSGDPAADQLAGTAEYWLLSTGERGVLPLTAIKHDRIRKEIDEAIEGILAGRFEKGPKCKGECDLLGATVCGIDW